MEQETTEAVQQADGDAVADDAQHELAGELLIEEISIDGMCGVY